MTTAIDGTTGSAFRDNHGTVLNVFGREVSVAELEHSVVDGPVPSKVVEHARSVFCAPEGFERAKKILHDRGLVVLYGSGAGRSHAAVRLLLDAGMTDLKRLDPAGNAVELTRETVPERVGYLWDGVRSGWLGDTPEHTVAKLEQFLTRESSFLLVVADRWDAQAHVTDRYSSRLIAPRLVDVVHAHLHANGISLAQGREIIAALDLRAAMQWHTGPRRGSRIAGELLQYHRGNRTAAQVHAELSRDNDDDVGEWYQQNQDVAVRSLALAIGFLEGCPYHVVAREARRLESTLLNPENADIWPYDPPNLFESTRTQLLAATTAHEEDPDLGMPGSGRVVFRPGWGMRLLRYTWKEYDRLRPILREWLTALDESSAASEDAQPFERFGELLRDLAEPDAVSWVASLLSDETSGKAVVAARMLEQFAGVPEHVESIKECLFTWSRPASTMRQRSAAAMTWRGTFGQDRPALALSELRKLAMCADAILLDKVVAAVIAVAADRDNRELVLKSIAHWCDRSSEVGPRKAGCRCSVKMFALDDGVSQVAEGEREHYRVLAATLLRRDTYRAMFLDRLVTSASLAEHDRVLWQRFMELLRLLLDVRRWPHADRASYYFRKKAVLGGSWARPFAAAVFEVLEEVGHDG